jgi:hypothetical protein
MNYKNKIMAKASRFNNYDFVLSNKTKNIIDMPVVPQPSAWSNQLGFYNAENNILVQAKPGADFDEWGEIKVYFVVDHEAPDFSDDEGYQNYISQDRTQHQGIVTAVPKKMIAEESIHNFEDATNPEFKDMRYEKRFENN